LPSLVVIPEEAEVVVGIYDRIVRGKNQSDTALWLEDNPVYRARSKARAFGSFKRSVRRMLQSRTYVGLQEPAIS
jgi:hypothetical protein